MLYLIKDITTCLITGHSKACTMKIVSTEEEVLDYLREVENLKKFKGDIKIEKVIL